MPTRSHRFVRNFLAASGLFLAPLLALNLLVDPHGAGPLGVLPPLVASDRLTKLELLRRAPASPQVWILGSSRTFTLSPAIVRETTGLTCLNMAVANCRAEGYFLLLKLARDLDRLPEVIVLGVDVEAFHDGLPLDPRWNRVGHVRSMVPDLREPWHTLVLRRLTAFLSLDTTVDSLYSIRRQVAPPRHPPTLDYKDDGSVAFAFLESQARVGMFDLEAQLDESVERSRRRYDNFDDLSEARLRYFEQFLSMSQAAGIRLTVFLTPLHPDIRHDLGRETHYSRLKGSLWTHLLQRKRTYGFDLQDYTRPVDFAGLDAQFWDGDHINETNASRLLHRLLVSSPAAFPTAPPTHAIQ